MDKSAIEQIQLSQAITSAQEAISKQKLANPVVAVPSNFEIKDLERYLPNKTRFTGDLVTSSIDDFAAFALDNKEEGSKCFINKDNAQARVIFNLGDAKKAGHADFTATLVLEKTAEFNALMSINGEHCTQRRLAEFIEDWADFITPLDSEGAPIALAKAVGAIRRLTIEAKAKAEHEVQDFRSSRSALENIEAKTDTGMPAEILFECEPYSGLPGFSFYARLSIITGEEPKFSFRIKRLEKLEDEIMEAFKDLVIDKLNGQIPTYLGVFNTEF